MVNLRRNIGDCGRDSGDENAAEVKVVEVDYGGVNS